MGVVYTKNSDLTSDTLYITLLGISFDLINSPCS